MESANGERDTWRAMSEENVELVRALTEAWQRRDQESTFDHVDPEVEWDATRIADVIPDVAGIYRGHDGVRAYWRRWLSAWGDLQFDIEAVRDAGDDVVLLVQNHRQWGRHSGIKFELPPYGGVFTIRGGKIVRVRWFPDQQSALDAAGLSR
jgi:ketosteroid isomerase-like protein